jgi:hypothetical protein
MKRCPTKIYRSCSIRGRVLSRMPMIRPGPVLIRRALYYLFVRWFDLVSPEMFSRQWTPDHPIQTPAGLRDGREAAGLLSKAAREIIQDYDSLNVAWGDVYRFRLGGFDYPANGGRSNTASTGSFTLRETGTINTGRLPVTAMWPLRSSGSTSGLGCCGVMVILHSRRAGILEINYHCLRGAN